MINGRNNELQRLKRLCQETGAFDELPPNIFSFIIKHYTDMVPYHNAVRILWGLLWLHKMQAPLLAKLSWVGHDAGHTGNTITSPEVRSASLFSSWLSIHRDWLEKNDLRLDGQDVVIPIMETCYPYQAPALTKSGAWLRIADSVRLISGDTIECFNEEHATPLQAFLFEIFHLVDELSTLSDPDQTTVINWLVQDELQNFFSKVKENFFLENKKPKGIYKPFVEKIRKVEERLSSYLLEQDMSDNLFRLYEELKNDITFISFVQIATEVGVK